MSTGHAGNSTDSGGHEHRFIDEVPIDPDALRAIGDALRYAAVIAAVGTDPDDPAALVSTLVVIGDRMQSCCALSAATALRNYADRLVELHGASGCEQH